MKVCKNLVCQLTVSAAYFAKEIDEDGLANHPCRDIVVSIKRKPHLFIGGMGRHTMPIIMLNNERTDESTNDALIDPKEEPCMEIRYYPPPPMVDLPRRNDGANNFRHHGGKGSWRK